MKKGNKELLVVGDRLLIVPDVGEERSNAGLYLPKWAVEKESIQAGRIVEVGPGIPLPALATDLFHMEPPGAFIRSLSTGS